MGMGFSWTTYAPRTLNQATAPPSGYIGVSGELVAGGETCVTSVVVVVSVCAVWGLDEDATGITDAVEYVLYAVEVCFGSI